MAQLPSLAVGPPRQDSILPIQWDAQNEGLSCLGEEIVALDGKLDKGSSALQVLTVNEQALSVLSGSLASFRTASTELYVPPHSKAESLQNGCVSNFRNDLQSGRRTSPLQKVEDFTRDKTRRPESSKRSHKKRKRSQTELATVDVEAAIATVVRAAEAIVVCHVLDGSNLSSGYGRSVVVEAALSLGKARELCGLDKYDLSATTDDSGDLAMQHLDDKTMQEAYEDVGMIVDVPEEERQFLDAGTEVVSLCQRKTKVTRRSASDTSDPLHSNRHTTSEVSKEPAQNHKSVECSRNSEVEGGSIVAQPTELGSHLETIHVCQGHERTGDVAQVHSLGMQEVKETAAKFQVAEGVSTTEISVPSKVYELVLDPEVKEPSPGYKSMAVVSSDPGVEIAETVAGNQEYVGDCQQETEVLQEMDLPALKSKPVGVFSTEVIQCQRDAESPAVFLASTSHRSEAQQVVGEAVPKCDAVLTEAIRSMEAVSYGPEDKSEEKVAQVSEAEMMIKDTSTNSDMFCGDFLLRSDSVVGGFQNKGEHKEEVEAEAAVTVEVGVAENKAVQSFESRELQAELSLPPIVLASSETKRSNPGVDRNPVILKDPSLDHATKILVTGYVSRWFGGWSGSAEFNPSATVTAEGNTDVVRISPAMLNDIGSEDAVPERNAFLARQKRTPCGQETLHSDRVSVDEADVNCLPQYDEAISEEAQSGHSHLQALPMSQIDPLCSFVPCSISPPAVLSLLPCQRDHQSSILAATVEACARTAMNVIDSRKVTDRLQAGQTAGLERLDPTVRAHNEISGQQIPEGRRDSVSPAVTKDGAVKRRPTLMKKLSTTTDSLSLLLHAVDVAEDCIPEGDDLKHPSTRSPNLIPRSPPLDCDHPEGMQAEVGQSADCGSQSTTYMPDVPPNASGRRVPKKRRMPSPDSWMCANLSDSPPLLWPRGTKRRLTARIVIDSDSTEWLHHDADEQHMAQKNLNDKEEHTLQSVTKPSGGPILRTSIRSSKPCLDPKTLFNGVQFLLTGFSSQKKEKLSKSIEQYGGVLLANVPAFSPKQRFKRRGVDCGARSPPIVIAPQQMRTHKYLYGCAVGAPLLNASWISASVSAVKCLDYHQYQHRQTKSGCVLQTDNGVVSKSSDSPLFVGFQFLFHGQQDSISQLSTLAKHAGGKVIRKLVLNGSEQKQGQKLVGVVVVEGSSNLPLELQRAASKLEWQVVDAEWVVVSLLSGKLVPFPTNCTPPSSVFPTQQSSASKTGEPSLQRYSRRRIRLQSENLENRSDGNSRIELLVKKLKDRSPPDENHGPSSSLKQTRGKELDDNQGHVNNTCCWLGKGFTSPPQVPQLTDRVLGPYAHSLAHKKLPKKFLYYKAVLCNGLEYSLGDIVEVRTSSADAPPSVARIEGLWSEEGGRLPQTQAFQQGVRKKAFKIVVLKCRRFFRPSDTGFPGQQGVNTSNELYLSNDIENNASASDIVRRVRVKLETAGEVVQCDNWYDDDAADGDGQERAGPLLSVCHKKAIKPASNFADYFCSFFYDHVREALHRIKLNV